MSKNLDLTGQRFGMLTVTRRLRQSHAHAQWSWACLCDCGAEISVPTGQLRSGLARSCGCIDLAPEKRTETQTVPQEFADCVCARSVGKYFSGCDAVRTLFCAENGKCSFYKPCEEK